MSLSSGQRLGQYQLLQPIGRGGMGEVWRATDVTLRRDVAIKVLPDQFLADPERLARFEREARVLASLNHPHIASIYGFQSVDGVRILAMEFVEGEDVAQRLERGPIPLDQALPIALHIALALEHAHERGVIHRDLKPANVKIMASGGAKVLDFGLAKALADDEDSAESGFVGHLSPTITSPSRMTAPNVLLGTAAYMAPEQVRGHAADRRADIWGFGVVLMEMLTGRRLFEGETTSDTLAAVLRSNLDWSRLPKATPHSVRALLERCLTRDPMKRLRDIGEARIAIEAADGGSENGALMGQGLEGSVANRPAMPRRLRSVGLVVAGCVVGAALILIVAGKETGREAPLRKFRVVTTENPRGPTISPDGKRIAYIVGDRLMVQSLDDLSPKPLDTEAGVQLPFWSPDGRWVGYVSGSRILKTPVSGEPTQLVCDTGKPFPVPASTFYESGRGASWGEGGTVVITWADSEGVFSTPARGGDHQPMVTDSSISDLHDPSFLPGDKGILFAVHPRGVGAGANTIGVWTRGKRRDLLLVQDHVINHPIYSPTGHILFGRDSPTPGVWAIPFSLDGLEITGKPFLVAAGGYHPSVSVDGTLCYLPSDPNPARELVLVDRNGKDIAIIGKPEVSHQNTHVAISPDGTQVIRALGSNGTVLWVYDITRGTRMRISPESEISFGAAWLPDGKRISYTTTGRGEEKPRIMVRNSDGTGSADTLAKGAVPQFTVDGAFVTYSQVEDNFRRWSIVAAPRSGSGTVTTVVVGNPRAGLGAVSPAGSLMAYQSDESGKFEIYLTRFPSGEGKWQVSTDGGQFPHWDGRADRVYYAHENGIMEVTVSTSPGGAPALEGPKLLFTRPELGYADADTYPGFDVTRDGNRFAILRPVAADSKTGIVVVENWTKEFSGK